MKIKTLIAISSVTLFISCGEASFEEVQESQFGDELDFSQLLDSLEIDSYTRLEKEASEMDSIYLGEAEGILDIGAGIPQSREDLNNMRTVVKLYDGKSNAGISIPGFGGLKLGKKQSNLNVYYIESKVADSDGEPVVYGIGYSIHYLFDKVRKGINIKNLASVAASAQLEKSKTSVSYSMQSFGIRSNDLAKFFKPQVDGDFDVKGFGIIQSSIDGIQNVLTDSLLSSRAKFTPEQLYFIDVEDLRN